MSAHVAQNCNAHTAGIYRGSLENHILPALGMMPLSLVERAHVSALHYRLRETPRAANRALAVLSKMFSLAAAWGLVPDGTNPCRAVRKYKERKRERFLSREEYRRLGMALAEAEAEAGSGGRGLSLRHRRAPPPHAHRLPSERDPHAPLGRCGPHRRRVSAARRQDGHPHGPAHAHGGSRAGRHPPRAHNPWVIVGKQPGAHLPTITAEWYRLRARAGLDDVRIHDLRHSYTQAARSPPARASP